MGIRLRWVEGRYRIPKGGLKISRLTQNEGRVSKKKKERLDNPRSPENLQEWTQQRVKITKLGRSGREQSGMGHTRKRGVVLRRREEFRSTELKKRNSWVKGKVEGHENLNAAHIMN